MPRLLVAGETLIDFIPAAPGPLATVESFSRRPGGAPANVAVGLARLDRTPDLWTRVGQDPFGEFLLDTLAGAGLSLDFVERDPTAKTGLAFVSLGEDADREFSFHRDGSADTRLQPDRIDDATLAGYDWVHVGGVTLADEPARSATIDLVERVAASAIVSFDPNARPELWDEFSYAESMRELFGLVDVVKATPEDLDQLGIVGEAPALARAISERGPHTVLITLGDAGAYAYASGDAPWADAETEVRHGGYTVDPVDTTGAGDGFLAGAIAALVDGDPLDDVLAFANAVAAQTTLAEGAMTALPTREAVQRFKNA